jgi:hypothetical protein
MMFDVRKRRRCVDGGSHGRCLRVERQSEIR